MCSCFYVFLNQIIPFHLFYHSRQIKTQHLSVFTARISTFTILQPSSVTHTAARKNASAQAPSSPPSKAGAAGRLSSRRGWGCWLIQFQKRGISNCPGKPEFRQRSQNSSRSDLRLLRSSDRLLRAAEFRQAGAVRNIIVFSYGAGNTPQPSGRRKTGPRRPNEREGTGADAVLLALANR